MDWSGVVCRLRRAMNSKRARRHGEGGRRSSRARNDETKQSAPICTRLMDNMRSQARHRAMASLSWHCSQDGCPPVSSIMYHNAYVTGVSTRVVKSYTSASWRVDWYYQDVSCSSEIFDRMVSLRLSMHHRQLLHRGISLYACGSFISTFLPRTA